MRKSWREQRAVGGSNKELRTRTSDEVPCLNRPRCEAASMSERPPLIPQEGPAWAKLSYLAPCSRRSLRDHSTEQSGTPPVAHPHFRDPFSQLLAHLPILSSSPSSKPGSPSSHRPLLQLFSPWFTHQASPTPPLPLPPYFPLSPLFPFSAFLFQEEGRSWAHTCLSSKGFLGRWGAEAGSPGLPAPTCTPPTTRHALDTRAGADTDTRASDGTHMQTHTPATRDTGNSAHAATHQAHTQADRR